MVETGSRLRGITLDDLAARLSTVTQAQMAVLDVLASRNPPPTDKEIATVLNLAERTITTHMRNIFMDLQISGVRERKRDTVVDAWRRRVQAAS